MGQPVFQIALHKYWNCDGFIHIRIRYDIFSFAMDCRKFVSGFLVNTLIVVILSVYTRQQKISNCKFIYLI